MHLAVTMAAQSYEKRGGIWVTTSVFPIVYMVDVERLPRNIIVLFLTTNPTGIAKESTDPVLELFVKLLAIRLKRRPVVPIWILLTLQPDPEMLAPAFHRAIFSLCFNATRENLKFITTIQARGFYFSPFPKNIVRSPCFVLSLRWEVPPDLETGHHILSLDWVLHRFLMGGAKDRFVLL